jgi:superfamily II DNA or RNA helicase
MDAFWLGFEKQAKLRETTQLEPHQIRVKRRLEKSPGVLVYHGLGSGKSLTSLAATQGDKTDVVVPASLRPNYAKEVEKHTTGHKPNIMSYEKAVKTPASGNSLVIDEAHMLGDTGSLRTRNMIEKARDYDKRVLLTGTPIRNYPREIGPLMAMVRGDNKIPSDPAAFDNAFIQEVTQKPGLMARLLHGAKPGTEFRIKNPERFGELVKGYIDYHAPQKENFPSVSRETVQVPMSDEQTKYYDFVLGNAPAGLRYKIRRGLPPSKAEAKSFNTLLTGPRQVANTAASFGGKEISPKIQTALSELQKRMGEDKNFKGMVYSNYLGSGVNEYAKHLEAAGIPHAVFDGTMSDKKRKAAVDDYNAGRTKVLLISGAGAQGLDLKGTKLVQLLEPHWNSARLHQAEGRGIRFKSHEHLPLEERHVHVQKFHSTVPKTFFQRILRSKADLGVDEYLDNMSARKDALNEQFLQILRDKGSEKVSAFWNGFEKNAGTLRRLIKKERAKDPGNARRKHIKVAIEKAMSPGRISMAEASKADLKKLLASHEARETKEQEDEESPEEQKLEAKAGIHEKSAFWQGFERRRV